LRFVGVCYRAHDPRWSFAPLSGDGAAIHGGRFNPKGVATLYLARDPMTAVKEANQGFAHKIEPCVLCSYDVDCEDVVDLATDEGRASHGVAAQDMAIGWFSFLAEGREPPSWRLARRLMKEGAAGALVPSYATGATAQDRNLVLWDWGAQRPHKIAVFDPSGRLPRDQLSWRR
jgi:RES domain-containing protein